MKKCDHQGFYFIELSTAILTGWGRTGNGILAEIGDSRGMGEERARGGSTKRIGSGRIWQQCLIFCNENKEQGGSQKQNKK